MNSSIPVSVAYQGKLWDADATPTGAANMYKVSWCPVDGEPSWKASKIPLLPDRELKTADEAVITPDGKPPLWLRRVQESSKGSQRKKNANDAGMPEERPRRAPKVAKVVAATPAARSRRAPKVAKVVAATPAARSRRAPKVAEVVAATPAAIPAVAAAVAATPTAIPAVAAAVAVTPTAIPAVAVTATPPPWPLPPPLWPLPPPPWYTQQQYTQQQYTPQQYTPAPELTQALHDLTQVMQERQPRAAGSSSAATPVAKRPAGAPKTDCALKDAMPGRTHLQVNPKLQKKDAAMAAVQTATYGLQFKAIGPLSLNHERIEDAGEAAVDHRICAACQNADKHDTMKFDKDFPCTMCCRCAVMKRGKSVFCRQCRDGLERHEKDADNKKKFFFEQLMEPVTLVYHRWQVNNIWEWRTIGGFDDRRNEKRCDAVMEFKNVLGTQHVMVAVEFVLSSDITDVSLRDKRAALYRYARSPENTGCKIVFIMAYQTYKMTGADPADAALAEMVVLRQWITAAVLASPALPNGDEQMTLLTLGASDTQRKRPVICDGKHIPALCRPEASTHQWKHCVIWTENRHLNKAFDKRPAGSPNALMEQSGGLFGHAGLIRTNPDGES
jgi:hypothetical protein